MPSLFSACIWPEQHEKQKNKSTTSAYIDRCNSSLYWYHPCLPFGQGRPFFDIVFANSALFCLQSGITWNWLKICPKLRAQMFFGSAWCRSPLSRQPPCNNRIQRLAIRVAIALDFLRNKYTFLAETNPKRCSCNNNWTKTRQIWETSTNLANVSPSSPAAEGPLPHILCYTITITITQQKYVSSF